MNVTAHPSLAGQKGEGRETGQATRIRKSKLDPFRPEIEALLKNGATKTLVARRYGTSAANLHLWFKSGYVTRQEK